MKIPLFTAGTNESRSRDVDYQKTQNWYPSVEQSGKNNMVLYPTPGLTEFCTAGTGPIRGQLRYSSTALFVVSSDKFYEIGTGGSVTLRGTLNTTTGTVSMAHNGPNNGQQVCIVDGTDLYIWDSNAADFKVITDSGDPDYDVDCPAGATHVVFMDGYFVINDPSNDGRFYSSAGYDGTSWTNTAFATAERNPDKLQAIHVNGRELWLLGETTTEVWYNAGTATFPFAPMSNAYIDTGCVAPYSVASASGTMFWLGANEQGQGLVIMSTGLAPQIISTPGIANQIQQMTTISDAHGYVYQAYDHLFYVLTFPTEAKTFVFDPAIKMWHEWSSDGIGRHKGQNHSFFAGKHIIGDYLSGKLYYLDYSKYTDDGATITRIRRSPHIHADGKKLFHSTLKVAIEGGVGNDDVANPQMMMRYSDDGGHTWTSEKWRSMGASTGEYGVAPEWRRLGYSEDRVYEIKVTDAVKAIVIDGYVEVTPGTDLQ